MENTTELPPRVAYRYREFAAMVGVHPDTVKSWAKAGTIRSVTIGGTALIPASEVTRILGEEAA